MIPSPASAHQAYVSLAPRVVLNRYARALATLPQPRCVSFVYSVEQLGLRTLVQTHRVYRAGPRERDELLAADGSTLVVPSVRIFDDRTNRYDVETVAPRPGAYTFTYGGRASQNYVFRTSGQAGNAFTITQVQIDARTFLPVALKFRVTANGVAGAGDLRYARAERYWVIRQAQVEARLPSGGRARERIAWSAYQFPPSLPHATFLMPMPAETAAPAAPL